jgi:hypothetical protein
VIARIVDRKGVVKNREGGLNGNVIKKSNPDMASGVRGEGSVDMSRAVIIGLNISSAGACCWALIELDLVKGRCIWTNVGRVGFWGNVVVFSVLGMREVNVPWATPAIMVLPFFVSLVGDAINGIVTMREIAIGIGAKFVGTIRI